MAMDEAIAGEDRTRGLLRPRREDGRRVTFMELFFDLVYVFAVTQVTRMLLEHLTLGGAARALLLLLAVWWAWVDTAWVTNWFDPDRGPVRLMLIGAMLISLIMAATLPEAFGARGLLFAGAYVVMQVGRSLFVVAALRGEPALRMNFIRILSWSAVSGVLWIAGGLAHGSARDGLWLAAVIVESAAPAHGFFIPGLGRAQTTDWTITGGHLAERCQLFLIIVLGESILDTGVAFGEQDFSSAVIAALMVAFLGSVAFWWLYFNRTADGGSAAIEGSSDPGRLGRSAYTYFHLPMVAGIIVSAVGDDLSIAHPGEPAHGAIAAVVLGGPALFLAGHALFKRVVFGKLSLQRLLAIAVLLALGPFISTVPTLALATAAMLIVVAVAAWDAVTGWQVARALQSEAGISNRTTLGLPPETESGGQ